MRVNELVLEGSQQLHIKGIELKSEVKTDRFSQIMDNPQRVLMAIDILFSTQHNPTDSTIKKIIAEAKEQGKEYAGDVYFKGEDEEVYKRFDYVKMLKTINVLRRELRCVIGQSWDDFVRQKSGAPCRAFVTTQDETDLKDSIYKKLDFLGKYIDVEAKNSRIRELSDKANEYIAKLVEDCANGYDDFTGYDKVTGANDLVKLLYIAATDPDPKIRYEAIRKFLLIIVLGRQHEQTDKKDGTDNQNALTEMDDFLKKAFFPQRQPADSTVKRFLCFQVGQFLRKRQIMHARISHKKEKGVQSLDFPMRPAIVTDEKGEPRLIYYHSGIRPKSIESRTTKKFRDGRDIGEKGADDQNGLRFVFKTERDLRDFNRNMEDRLVAHLREMAEEIESDLERRIENYEEGSVPSKAELERRLANIKNRISTIEDSFEIIEEKDGLDGGMDPTSKAGGKLKVYKIKVKVKGIAEIPEEEREFVFEIQSFLPQGYAESIYEKTPGMHNVKRFFENGDFPGDMPFDLTHGLADLIWPKKLWPDADKAALMADAVEAAYRRDTANLERMGLISYARGTVEGAVKDLKRQVIELDAEAERLSEETGISKVDGLVQLGRERTSGWLREGRKRVWGALGNFGGRISNSKKAS